MTNIANIPPSDSSVLSLKALLTGLLATRAMGPVTPPHDPAGSPGITIMLADQVIAIDGETRGRLATLAASLHDILIRLNGAENPDADPFVPNDPVSRGRLAAALLALVVDTCSTADAQAYKDTLGTVIAGAVPERGPDSAPLIVQVMADVLFGLKTGTSSMFGR